MPRGLEGVMQSMEASFRRHLSMSTQLKNATDYSTHNQSQKTHSNPHKTIPIAYTGNMLLNFHLKKKFSVAE